MVLSGGLPKIGLQAVLQDADFRRGMSNYMRGVDDMMKKTGLAANSFTGQFLTMGSGVLAFGRAAVLGVGLAAGAVAGLGAVAAGEAIKWETAFGGVAKTVDGVMERSTDGVFRLTEAGAALEQQLRDIANETPITHQDIALIAEMGGAMGVTIDQLDEFARTIAGVQASTNLSAEGAAASFGRILTVMQGASATADDWQRLGSTVVDLGNNGNSTEQEIVEIAQRLMAASKVVGITTAEMLGLGAAIVDTGVNIEAGGTAISKGLYQINSAVIDGGEKLEEFSRIAGVTSDEFSEMWEKDAAGAFTKFIKGLSKEGKNAERVLRDLGINDSRQISAFLSLANSADNLESSLSRANAAWEENSALMDEVDKRNQTVQAQWGRFKNQIRDVGITIGKALLPSLAGFLGVMNNSVLPVLADFSKYVAAIIEDGDYMNDWLSHLPVPLRNVAKGFGRLVGAVFELVHGDIRGAMDALGVPSHVQESIIQFARNVDTFVRDTMLPFAREHAPEIQGAIVGIGAVLASSGIASALAGIAIKLAAINPVLGLLVGGAALLGAAWNGNWFGMRDTLTQVWEQHIAPALETARVWLAENIPAAIAEAQRWWDQELLPAMQRVGDWINTNFGTTFENVRKMLEENWPLALEEATKWWEEYLGPALEAVGTFINETLLPALGALSVKIAEEVAQAVNEFSTFIVEEVQPALLEWSRLLREDVIPALIGLRDAVADKVTPAASALVTFWKETLMPAFQETHRFVDQDLSPVFTEFARVMDELVRIRSEILAGVWNDELLPAGKVIWSLIKDDLKPIFDALQLLMVTAVTPAFLKLSDLLGGPFKSNAGEAKSLVDLLKEGFERLKAPLQAVEEWLRKVADALKGISWDKIKDVLRAWLPGSLPPLGQGMADIAEQAGMAAGALGSPAFTSALSGLGSLADIAVTNLGNLATSLLDVGKNALSNLFGGGETPTADSPGVSSGGGFGAPAGGAGIGSLAAQWQSVWDQINLITSTETAEMQGLHTLWLSNLQLGLTTFLETAYQAWITGYLRQRVFFATNSAAIVQTAGAFGERMTATLEETMAALQTIWETAWTLMQEILAAGSAQWILLVIGAMNAIQAAVREPNWPDVGLSIADGIASGINAGTGKIVEAARRAARAAYNAAKAELGIHSPARVMVPLGKEIPGGLAKGITSEVGVIEAAMRRMVSRSVARTRESTRESLSQSAGGGSNSITNIDRRVYLEMNPQYSQYQSEADVYLDAQAALAAARI